jgi:oxygen-independent coproporphyrinogen-3 oxidase
MLMMGLRLDEGVDIERHAALGGAHIDPAVLAGLVDLGLVECRPGRILATASGRALLNFVLRTIFDQYVSA